MDPLIAVYDACVLYPNFLRDFLVRLAVRGRDENILWAKWTGRIQGEWVRAVLRQPGRTRAQLRRTCRLMEERVCNCRVRGYRRWEPRLALPDPDDRHVLAAALACVADVIVTFNLSDFPPATLAPFGVAAVTPDDLVGRLSARGLSVTAVAAEHRASLTRPALTSADYLAALRRNGCPRTADALPAEHL